ncbi:MAG: YdcF family protein [Pyrinomonadaceae bacterium]
MSLTSRPQFFEILWRRGRIVLLLLLAWSILAWVAARVLVVRSELPHADALVVLAGSSTYVERTHHAAQLFAEGVAAKVVLTNDNLPSGWSAVQGRNPLFVERAADELRRQGVPAEKIEIVPGVVSSTYDEIMRLREYSVEHRLRSILVVTSAYHSRRAWWTLRHVFRGSDVTIGLDPAAPGEQSPWPATWWWHRVGWQMVPVEYAKMVYYWWRY